MNNNNKEIISLEKVCHQYGDGEPSLKDINLRIDQGEIVCIIGPSGSGKSTLLRCINWLERPQSGSIKIEDEEISESNVRMIRRKIGMVFQNFNLFPHMSVIQNVTFAPKNLKIEEDDKINSYAQKLLEYVDLDDKADAMPHELSGGQQQRVAIVRSLAMHPKIMLLDEATSALDPEMRGEVLDVIRCIAKKRDITLIMVTHEMAFAKNICNRVIFLENGQVLGDGDLFKKCKNDRINEFLSGSYNAGA